MRPEQAALLRRLQAEVEHAMGRFALAAEAVLVSATLREGTVVAIDGDTLVVEVDACA